MKLRRDTLFLAAGVAGLAAAAFGAIGAPRIDALGIGAAATVDDTTPASPNKAHRLTATAARRLLKLFMRSPSS